MERDQRSRQQKSRGGSFSRSAPPKRSLGSRMGLQKPGQVPQPPRGPSGQRPATPLQPGQRAAASRQRPQSQTGRTQRYSGQQLNPQKAGYTPGTPRRQRRVTQAELLRRRNQRRALGVLGVLAVLALGTIVSVNLLFKVTAFRVETFDRTTPADTGIYTEEEIITALGIEQNSNLFGFSTVEKTAQLQKMFPYLDDVQVDIQLPGTVVIKVTPAKEQFACMYSGGWIVLSDTLKILRSDLSQPEGLVLLSCSLPTDFTPVVGQFLMPQSYNSLLDGAVTATAESAQPTAPQVLEELLTYLQEYQLTDGLTALSVLDLSDVCFTYQDRIQVLLGNSTRLEYKIRLAASAILDAEKGLSATDSGTLDVSYQETDGEIKGYFAPDEPEPTPTPEPEENTDNDAAESEPAEE
ncbi:MAG TPA: FtsQ-type POTRA domain-containing protein [Candidatus Gemmiger excrementavium]|uniref:FtsQ-type POTRA domain-containing protein n=1 Tax=Candidatus Gemmiger excrementavium TaxID=2838608 RepID=A0A9D2JES4_9FIRM|nr:FtsQ-type POTRA domain-containing protein [Candidatus Gemmiger excrementavium]